MAALASQDRQRLGFMFCGIPSLDQGPAFSKVTQFLVLARMNLDCNMPEGKEMRPKIRAERNDDGACMSGREHGLSLHRQRAATAGVPEGFLQRHDTGWTLRSQAGGRENRAGL